MNEEYHKPFIKGLFVIAIVTIFAMVSSRFVVNYYMNQSFYPYKTIEYSSQKSQDEIKSIVVEW